MTTSCAGCNRKLPFTRMVLHTDHRYYGQCCIRSVNGELAAAMEENKWDHEFDSRPNKWWPE